MHNQSFTLTSREISTLAKGVSIEVIDHLNQFVQTIKESPEYKYFPEGFNREGDYLFSQLQTLVEIEKEYNDRVKEADGYFNYQVENLSDIKEYIRSYNRFCVYGNEMPLDRANVSLRAEKVYDAYVTKIRDEVYNLSIPDHSTVYELAKAMIIAEYKSKQHESVKDLLGEVYDLLLEKYVKNAANQ
jgi:uncharacterized protein YifE (UPF0438 family)